MHKVKCHCLNDMLLGTEWFILLVMYSLSCGRIILE